MAHLDFSAGIPLRIAAISGLALAAACAPESLGDPRYAGESCRRVTLIDERTGAAIVGAEDMAIDRRRDRLIVSAYDRRAAERAARRKAFQVPEGGLYELDLNALRQPDGRLVAARPLLDADAVAGGLRPHGLDYDPERGEVAFVNRGYQKIDERWRMTPRLERASIFGDIVEVSGEEAPCAANDVLVSDVGAFVSFDHGDCGWRGMAEDVFGFARSGIASAGGAPLFEAAKFANGIAELRNGDIALADTKSSSIVVLTKAGDGFDEERRVTTPGGPDNLTIAEDGRVIAALHPSLIWIGAHRKLGFGNAPSRVVKVDPDSGDVELLFDNVVGHRFSAATVAVEDDKTLVLGSVTEPGVLVCRRG